MMDNLLRVQGTDLRGLALAANLHRAVPQDDGDEVMSQDKAEDFQRVQLIEIGELHSSNEDGPVTLPLLDCWVYPAFGSETLPTHPTSLSRIRLVLSPQQLLDLAQRIQDLEGGCQIQAPPPPPFSVQ